MAVVSTHAPTFQRLVGSQCLESLGLSSMNEGGVRDDIAAGGPRRGMAERQATMNADAVKGSMC